MKRVLLLVMAVVTMVSAAVAADKNKKQAAAPGKKTSKVTASKTTDYIDSTEVQWLNWNQVQEKMKTQPKKVWVDIYTDWCGWCKKMDATTFTNKELIKYMNK